MATTTRGNETVSLLGADVSIPSGLELEILARGVDPISADRVRRYQECQVQAFRARAGWWGKHVGLVWWLCLANIFLFLLSAIELWVGGLVFGMRTFLFLVLASASFLIVGFFLPGTKLGNAMSHWESAVSYRYQGEIPDRIRTMISVVSMIPETTVYVEHFRDDPFISIRRIDGNAEERCYFGYWDAPGFENFI